MNTLNRFRFQRTSINNIVYYLTASDVFTWGLMVIINVFTGVYLAERLGFSEGETLKLIGTGTAIFSLSNGLLQIPLGLLVDRLKGFKDEVYMLMIGNSLMGIPIMFYPLISTEIIFYLLQFSIGIGSAMNLVAWRKLFATKIDKGKEGLEYGVYEVIMSVSIGLFSLLAGYVTAISSQYFDLVMVGIGFTMVLSSFWPYMVLREIEKPKEK